MKTLPPQYRIDLWTKEFSVVLMNANHKYFSSPRLSVGTPHRAEKQPSTLTQINMTGLTTFMRNTPSFSSTPLRVAMCGL